MRRKESYLLAAVLLIVAALSGCTGAPEPALTQPPETQPAQSLGEVYLYGEQHGSEAVLDRELEL